MVRVALLLQVLTCASRVRIRLPIQGVLSETGKDLVLLERLIVTNLWFRRVPMLVNLGLFIGMAMRLLRAGAERADP